MTIVDRIPRPGLVLVAVLVALVVPSALADAAFAGNASMRPSVQGFGVVNGPAYACTNYNRDDRQIQSGCTTVTIFSSIMSPATLTLTATPFTAQGNQFSRWEGCTRPLDSFATVVASGNTCTLTVNWLTPSLTLTPRAVFDDVVGPTTTALFPIPSLITDRGVSFLVMANELTTDSECSVDNGIFADCGVLRVFAEGAHQVRARSIDRSGNVGAIAGPWDFTVIDTQLVSGPADFSADRRPTFTFSTVAGDRFECSIDNPTVTACGAKDPSTGRASFTPPADLGEGEHKFIVRAVGADTDPVPVVRTWRVDTTAPVVTGLTSPTVLEGIVTMSRSAAFSWSATDAGGIERFECRLDGGAFAPCTSPKELTGLPFGARAFSVRGVDKAGNVSAPVTRQWTVAAPDNDGDGFDQRSDCDDGNAQINPNASDTPGNGIDENCDGADATIPPPAPAPAPVPVTGGGASTGTSAVRGAGAARAHNPARVSAKGSARRTRIVFTRLSATRVPVGARITVTCKAKRRGACPFRTKRTTAKRATVNLIKTLAAKRRGKRGKSLTFRAPAVLTITITRAGMAPKTLRYTMATGKFPRARQI